MNTKINILLLEDLPSDAWLLEQALKEAKLDFNIQVADTKEKYIYGLTHFAPDIILSDHSLPSFGSQEALVILKQTGKNIPFVLVTGAMSDEAAVNLMKQGADDYIIKDRLHKLPTAIRNCLEKFRLQKEQQIAIDDVIRNEKHFRALIKNIHDAILLIDVNTEFTYQSPSTTHITGFSFDDVKNAKLFEYIHPEDLRPCSMLFEEARAEPGLPLPARLRMKHRKGHYIWTEGTISNLLNDESVHAFIYVFRDITERKKVEDEINFFRMYAESIVSTVREPLIIINENMVVRSANLSFYKKFNTTQVLTEGQDFFMLANNRWDDPELRKLLSHILPGKTKLVNYEFLYSFSPGVKRILLLNATAIKHNAMDQPSILLAVDDITEKRRLELEMKDFSAKLEKEVFERTLLLCEANIALQHSNKKLEQFAFVASHDLQEPLRKIKTYASFLYEGFAGTLPADANNLITKISYSAERMSTLIDQLLNYSTVSSEEALFEKADLNKIIDDVKADFSQLINEKNAVITCKDLPRIDMVPSQMKQLFHNLVSNSLKFSRSETPVVISITSKRLKPQELKKYTNLNQELSYIDITVKDNGIGFEQQFAEKMFLIFHRLNSRGKFPGTGIGLALCKAIVINHHGEIFATSNTKTGSIFHIVLPLVQKGSVEEIWETNSLKEHAVHQGRLS